VKPTFRDDPSKFLYYNGPTKFSRRALEREHDLFAHRAALFFTPTANIPAAFIGEGVLNVRLPLASPTVYEFDEIPGLRSPRLWVELLQRNTRKLRWRPFGKSRVSLVCFDSHRWGPNRTGHKALLDALKVQTTGRGDGRRLYYFGAIEDDDQARLVEFKLKEELIEDPADAHCVVCVEPA
jgi:hypothetical protein